MKDSKTEMLEVLNLVSHQFSKFDYCSRRRMTELKCSADIPNIHVEDRSVHAVAVGRYRFTFSPFFIKMFAAAFLDIPFS